MSKKGLLIVVSAPSGGGKDTIIEQVRSIYDNVYYSVSATTREIRDGETDGVSYYFITKPDFEKLIENGEVIEYTTYCEHYYGTPKQPINKMLAEGKNVILKIEVEGAMNIKNLYPDSILVFILPPSMEELRHRLERRGSESAAVIEKRLSRAKAEFKYAYKYDYLLINDKLEDAVNDLISIIKAEEMKTSHNKELIDKILE